MIIGTFWRFFLIGLVFSYSLRLSMYLFCRLLPMLVSSIFRTHYSVIFIIFLFFISSSLLGIPCMLSWLSCFFFYFFFFSVSFFVFSRSWFFLLFIIIGIFIYLILLLFVSVIIFFVYSFAHNFIFSRLLGLLYFYGSLFVLFFFTFGLFFFYFIIVNSVFLFFHPFVFLHFFRYHVYLVYLVFLSYYVSFYLFNCVCVCKCIAPFIRSNGRFSWYYWVDASVVQFYNYYCWRIRSVSVIHYALLILFVHFYRLSC